MKPESNPLPDALKSIQDVIFMHVQPAVRKVFQTPPFVKNAELQRLRLDFDIALETALQQGLLKLMQPIKRSEHRGIIGASFASFENLSLMDKDELSLQIQANDFSARVFEACASDLATIVMRFEHVAAQELELDDTLLSPDVLSEILKAQILAFPVDSVLKLDFFKQLLRSLAKQYAEITLAVNNAFIDHGVLADLNESDGKARAKRIEARVQAKVKRQSLITSISQNVKYDAQGNAIAPSMNEVLEHLDISETQAEHVIASLAEAEDISEVGLLAHIDAIYKKEQPAIVDSEYATKKNQGSFASQLTQQASLDHYVLSKKNTSTIGMMSMLFDDIFRQDDFAEPIKALLEQLQIPLLKTAILDKNFFADSNNPAQTLLDSLAESGASWSPETDPSRDFLYKKMAEIVATVNREFDNSYGVFVNAIFDFTAFKKKHQQRAIRIEERIVSMEKAVARQDRARHEAARHISSVFNAFKLPDALRYFVSEPWQSVLFYIHNKYDNSKNPQWHNAIEAELQLVRVLSGHAEQDKKAAIYALQKEMLGVGQQKSDVNSELNKVIPFIAPVEKMPLPKNVVSMQSHAQNAKHADTVNSLVDAAVSFEGRPSDIYGDSALAENEEEMLEAIAVNAQKLIDQLQEDLTVGTWLSDGASGEKVKIKVAAYIKHTDTYILVNRNGTKYASWSSLEVTARLQAQTLRLIESAMVFDRALESVIVGLRR